MLYFSERVREVQRLVNAMTCLSFEEEVGFQNAFNSCKTLCVQQQDSMRATARLYACNKAGFHNTLSERVCVLAVFELELGRWVCLCVNWGGVCVCLSINVRTSETIPRFHACQTIPLEMNC